LRLLSKNIQRSDIEAYQTYSIVEVTIIQISPEEKAAEKNKLKKSELFENT
jgi:hypothetical protein